MQIKKRGIPFKNYTAGESMREGKRYCEWTAFLDIETMLLSRSDNGGCRIIRKWKWHGDPEAAAITETLDLTPEQTLRFEENYRYGDFLNV
jgi:hypothetical protein